jgi:hypothetical protein
VNKPPRTQDKTGDGIWGLGLLVLLSGASYYSLLSVTAATEMANRSLIRKQHAIRAMDQGTRDVAAGVDKTSASGEALQEIIQMSAKVGDVISEITAAANQQSDATPAVQHQLVPNLETGSGIFGCRHPNCQRLYRPFEPPLSTCAD